MKAGLLLLLTTALQATEIEGTVWYDAKGKIAVVDGPAAEKKAPEPFVPKWVAREERRDRALRGEFRHRTSRSRSYGEGGWAWSYPASYYFGTGGGYCRPRTYPFAGTGLRAIIR
ncbi:hypothetical protein [Luteolibacter sp. Populi]|uniref:hypothetical protein n=1 Tax=Luteolibacter sp. Populi TaxID=3230487 RepID=UPI0034672FDD